MSAEANKTAKRRYFEAFWTIERPAARIVCPGSSNARAVQIRVNTTLSMTVIMVASPRNRYQPWC